MAQPTGLSLYPHQSLPGPSPISTYEPWCRLRGHEPWPVDTFLFAEWYAIHIRSPGSVLPLHFWPVYFSTIRFYGGAAGLVNRERDVTEFLSRNQHHPDLRFVVQWVGLSEVTRIAVICIELRMYTQRWENADTMGVGIFEKVIRKMQCPTSEPWEKFDDEPLPEVDTETHSTLDTWIETVAKRGAWDFAYPLIQSTIRKDGWTCAMEVGLTEWQTIFTSSPTSELLRCNFNKKELEWITRPNAWIDKNFSAMRKTINDYLNDIGILTRIHGKIAAAANLMRLFGDVKRENFYIHLNYRLLEWPSLIQLEKEFTRVSLVQELRACGMMAPFWEQNNARKAEDMMDIIFDWDDLVFDDHEGEEKAEMTLIRRSRLLDERGKGLLAKLRPSFDQTESLTARQWNRLIGGVRT